MRPTLWTRLDNLARQLTPFGLTILLVIVSQVPLHFPGVARISPMLPLIAIYHWTIHRPDLMPPYAVFVIGLLVDFLAGTPVGVNAIVMLTVYGIIYSQRRFFLGKSFPISWLGFLLVSAGAAMLTWIFVSTFYVRLIRPDAMIFQYLVSLAIYPLPAWFFLRWQQIFLRTT